MNKALATLAGLTAGVSAMAQSIPAPEVEKRPYHSPYPHNKHKRLLWYKRRAKEKHRRYINKLKRRNGWK